MTDEPTLKQFNFLKGKGKWVEGMTKQQAHEAIALIIPASHTGQNPLAHEPSKTTDAGAEVVPMNPPKTISEDLERVFGNPSPKKSYELTDGNIRIGALTCAIDVTTSKTWDCLNIFEASGFWDIVKQFEEYIRNGK